MKKLILTILYLFEICVHFAWCDDCADFYPLNTGDTHVYEIESSGTTIKDYLTRKVIGDTLFKNDSSIFKVIEVIDTRKDSPTYIYQRFDTATCSVYQMFPIGQSETINFGLNPGDRYFIENSNATFSFNILKFMGMQVENCVFQVPCNADDCFYLTFAKGLGKTFISTTRISAFSSFSHSETLIYAKIKGIEYGINPVSVTDNFYNKLSAEIYPNPGKSITSTLNYNLDHPTQLSIILYNTKGEMLRELYNGSHKGGSFKMEIENFSLSQGIYFIRLQYGDRAETLKYIVTK